MLNVTTTTVYTRNDLEGHRTRLLAAEKGDLVIHRIVSEFPPELVNLNPTRALPLILDKGFILHGPTLVDSFFEERYPLPSLLPTSPLPRAKVRLLAATIRDLYPLAETGTHEQIQQLHTHLDDFNSLLDPRFPYFLGQLYSFIDVAISPLLHIAPQLGYHIQFNSNLYHYFNRITSRRSWPLSEPPDAIRTALDVGFEVRFLH